MSVGDQHVLDFRYVLEELLGSGVSVIHGSLVLKSSDGGVDIRYLVLLVSHFLLQLLCQLVNVVDRLFDIDSLPERPELLLELDLLDLFLRILV